MKTRIWRLTLDTNPEDCNLACIMCEEHSSYSSYIREKLNGRKRRMPENWLEPIFRQAKELGVKEIIPSTMGEPLLYKHFDRIMDLCRKYNIAMNLTTNGTFPANYGYKVQGWAVKIIPITTDVKISWNGHTADTAQKIMIGLDFKNAISNLKQLIAFRDEHHIQSGHYCRITLQLTFMQNNMQELSELIPWAASLGIDRIKGHHLWTHFPETQALSFRNSQESIAMWNSLVKTAHEAAEVKKPDGTNILLENFGPLQNNTTQEIPVDYCCPFLGKELWISATGKISPCCAPDEQRNTLGDFGNIQSHSLSEIIESKPYQTLMADYRNHPLCRQCNMRVPR